MKLPKKHSQKLNSLVVGVTALTGFVVMYKDALSETMSVSTVLLLIGALSVASAVLVNYKQNL